MWIDDYGLLKRQDINLGGEFIFRYQENELKIEKNNQYFTNFFGNRITNITGIVGENGSGKTSIIRFFLETFSMDMLSAINAIIILKHDEKYYCYYNREKINKLLIDERYKAIINVCALPNKEKNLENEVEYLKNISRIYYSSSFSESTYRGSSRHEENNSTQNLSTLYQVNNLHSNNVQAFFYRNRIQTIHFMCENKENLEDLIQIKMPQYIKIIDTYNFKRLRDTFISLLEEMKFDSKIITEIKVFIENSIRDSYKSEKRDGDFKLYKIYMYITIFIKYINKLKSPNYIVWNDNKDINTIYSIIVSNMQIGEEIDSLYKNLIFIINKLNELSKYIYEEDCNFTANNLKVIELLNLIDMFKDKIFIKGGFMIELQEYKLLDELIILCELLFDKSDNISNRDKSLDFLHFQWYDSKFEAMYLSSGEEAMLSLFTRIYYAIESINKEFDSKNILLVLEEPELYLHPNWQRKLISIIINFIEKILKNKVQIIFSSNTPFLISDLPKNNIIFMQKDIENNLCKISNGISQHKETFAQNIHVLLRESFFMDEGTQGEFAKSKIKELIDELKSIKEIGKKIDYSKCDILKRKIDMIGEPLIKNILLGIMDEIEIEEEYNLRTIEDEINFYRRKIETLKRLKKEIDTNGDKND
jgi:Predicted ATP-dependent endonuclease of the OLD family